VAPFKRVRPMAHERDPNYRTGRPTTYKPEYCDQVEAWMGKGHSLTSFAGSIKTNKDTIYAWMNTHTEFSDAVSRGHAARLVPWEEKLLHAEKGGEVAATIFALKNVAPDEYREVRYASFDHNIKLDTLSDEQLLAIASGRRPAEVGAIDVQYNRLLERPKPYREPKGKRGKGKR